MRNVRDVNTVVCRVPGGDQGTRRLGIAMVFLARKGAHDPELVKWARAIVRDIPSKAHYSTARRLLDWVRQNVKYRFDPLGLEWQQSPKETLLYAGQGDCFAKGTKVLRREGHALVDIETLRVGDAVWGHDRWSEVTATFEKGVQPTWIVTLNNGGSVRLTPNHHVWRVTEKGEERVEVSELKAGDRVLSPDRVGFGSESMDPGMAYIEGLYLADGFDHGKFSFRISGRDGFPREAQKREVQEICARLGVETTWGKTSITVKDPDWTARMLSCGSVAWEKKALSINYDEPTAKEFLRGIMADSGFTTTGHGRGWSSSSRDLWLQTRVLLKMFGVSCGTAHLTPPQHGSTSRQDIWRLGIRSTLSFLGKIHKKLWSARDVGVERQRPDKILCVKSIVKDGLAVPCFDITTDDHKVWLPEADWTTSQCNNMAALVSALSLGLGYPSTIRFVKADASRRDEFSHVYSIISVPDGQGGDSNLALDTTQASAEPGWECPHWATLDFDVANWVPQTADDQQWLDQVSAYYDQANSLKGMGAAW